MSKKIVAIVGSYRKHGSVDSAVDEILCAARDLGAETEKIHLMDKHIEYCINCRKCTQSPGPDRCPCIHKDDMEEIFTKIDNADGLILAAPVNFFNLTAIFRKFMERFVCYSYWPWGMAAPKRRPQSRKNKKAVLVTANAMPAFMGRILTGAIRALKSITKLVGAKTVATIFIGMASMGPKQPLPKSIVKKSRRAAAKLMA